MTMAATVEIAGARGTVADGDWSSDRPDLLDMLRLVTHGPYGPSGATPNPDLALANEAARRFGGKVVAFDPVEYDPAVAY